MRFSGVNSHRIDWNNLTTKHIQTSLKWVAIFTIQFKSLSVFPDNGRTKPEKKISV